MNGQPDVSGPRDLRCSDVDRERVAEALREAAGDGRLTLSELEERLDVTFRARTYGDLEPMTRDLPAGPHPVPGLPVPARTVPARTVPARPPVPSGSRHPVARTERITTVLGDERRGGRWEVPSRLEVGAFLGQVVLDFTEAIVRHREIVVQVAAVLGSVTFVVPDGIDVRMEPGLSIMGERRHRLGGPITPGGPVYRVRGLVVLGEITVRPPRHRRSVFGR